VSGPTDGPAPYHVSYSGAVRQRLKDLAAAARARGDGEDFLAALREFDRRLRVYPQFGDPLVDLHDHPGQVRLGVVPPLAMRYGVLEEQRQVFVAALPVLLSRSDAAGG
jgi:hypothetical protein